MLKNLCERCQSETFTVIPSETPNRPVRAAAPRSVRRSGFFSILRNKILSQVLLFIAEDLQPILQAFSHQVSASRIASFPFVHYKLQAAAKLGKPRVA